MRKIVCLDGWGLYLGPKPNELCGHVALGTKVEIRYVGTDMRSNIVRKQSLQTHRTFQKLRLRPSGYKFARCQTDFHLVEDVYIQNTSDQQPSLLALVWCSAIWDDASSAFLGSYHYHIGEGDWADFLVSVSPR